jgi:hypothetical protein
VSEAKERDERRQAVADLFALWWERHGDKPIAVRDLDESVEQALDPQGRGRQFVASKVGMLAGARTGGFVFTRHVPAGKWSAATYTLTKVEGPEA